MATPTMKNTRKATERRVEDRRHVEYEFNSPSWIEHVNLYYVASPRFERREATRRKNERRHDRSEPLRAHDETSDYNSSLLSVEEKLFFDNLFSKGMGH